MGKRTLVVLLGCVGAGKTTQARLLERDYEFTYLGTGEVLREEVRRQSELGRQLQSELAAGGFAPDELMQSIVAGRLQEPSQNGFVLDGFPRTLAQARWLDEELCRIGAMTMVVVYFKISESVCEQRLLRRGQINPHPRPEDSVDAIPRRLDEYHRKTEPILQHWQERLIEIDASGNHESVYGRFAEALDRVGALNAVSEQDIVFSG